AASERWRRLLATEVLLPKLGMNTESARIVLWRRREGEEIAVGDVLAEVETDKATIELEAETAGTVRKLLVEEGARVALSQAVAIIGSADEDVSALVERGVTPPVAAPRHVDRVYDAWHTASQASAPQRPNGTDPAARADAA